MTPFLTSVVRIGLHSAKVSRLLITAQPSKWPTTWPNGSELSRGELAILGREPLKVADVRIKGLTIHFELLLSLHHYITSSLDPLIFVSPPIIEVASTAALLLVMHLLPSSDASNHQV